MGILQSASIIKSIISTPVHRFTDSPGILHQLMDDMVFKLRCVLNGHEGDVLGLAVTPDDCIISCSRDKTAKLWLPERATNGYVPTETYISEQNLNTKFLTCVCVIPPNDKFSSGLILTGGNNNHIQVFEPESSTPFLQLTGHSNTICKLVNSLKTNVVLSASWDSTVKMWCISAEDSKCILTIGNHTTVWAVLHLKQDLICTGSADKIIRIFSPEGNLIKILAGHEDSIRDLVELNNDEILSCSNDTMIRKWCISTGECLQVLHGHPNYIYSIRVSKDMIISGGEDRYLLLWSTSKGRHLQIITLPTRSIWAIAILSNNDIVIGCSDGAIRIFTSDEKRQADEEALRNFANECATFEVPFKKYLGRSKISRLPGPDCLKVAGTKEGQTKIVRGNDMIICYSWSLTDRMWKKLGNIQAHGHASKMLKRANSEYSANADVKKSRNLPFYYRINTINELQEWFRIFCQRNNCVYRRTSTKKNTRSFLAYSEFYRCYRGCKSRVSNEIRTKGNGCNSTIYIHFEIKRDTYVLPCYTKVTINFVHNHKRGTSLKDKKAEMFPCSTLESSDNRPDCVSMHEKAETALHNYSSIDHCSPRERENPRFELTEHRKHGVLNSDQPKVEMVANIDDMIVEVDIEHRTAERSDQNDEELSRLEKKFYLLVNKLEKEVSYYGNGMLVMINELRKVCELPAPFVLSALLSFNKAAKNT